MTFISLISRRGKFARLPRVQEFLYKVITVFCLKLNGIFLDISTLTNFVVSFAEAVKMSLMAQMKRLKELEEVDTVLGWSDERKKAEYIGQVMEYKKFCNRAIALANSKIRSWCAYLQTYVPPSALPPTLSTTTSVTYVPVTPKPNRQVEK